MPRVICIVERNALSSALVEAALNKAAAVQDKIVMVIVAAALDGLHGL
jgi:uncharacterized membrane protein YwzB